MLILFKGDVKCVFLNLLFWRWQLGPEKGVIHLATAAVLNAVWDLWARVEGKVGPRDWPIISLSFTNMTHRDSRPVVFSRSRCGNSSLTWWVPVNWNGRFMFRLCRREVWCIVCVCVCYFRIPSRSCHASTSDTSLTLWQRRRLWVRLFMIRCPVTNLCLVNS